MHLGILLSFKLQALGIHCMECAADSAGGVLLDCSGGSGDEGQRVESKKGTTLPLQEQFHIENSLQYCLFLKE